MRAFLDFLANNFGSFFEGGAEVFIWFFNRAVAASWIILAVIVLRIFLKRTPKWITCALWGVCALRLILPFSFQSVLSLVPSGETLPPEVIYEKHPYIDVGIDAVDNTVNNYIAENFYEGETVAEGAQLSIASLVAVLWLVGVAVIIIYAVISFLGLKKRLKGAFEIEKGVFESSVVSSPFILGFFRPRIYLPVGLDEQTTDFVLRHERAHLNRADHIIKPLGFVILALYWFDPLVWIAYILFCRDIELACDQRVIKNLEKEQRADYAQALLDCAVSNKRFSPCPLAFGEVSIKDRVKSALNYKKPMLWIVIVAIISAAAVTVCFLTDPVKKNGVADVVDAPQYCEDVFVSFHFLEFDSKYPIITVAWNSFSEDNITFGDEFGIKRLENGKWVDCSTEDVSFKDITNILKANESIKDKSYSLKGFDLSKPGEYRFIPPIGETEYLEFTLIETPEFTNAVDYKSDIYCIDDGGEEGFQIFNSLSEIRKDSTRTTPIVRVESRAELLALSEKMEPYFILEGDSPQYKGFDDLLRECDTAFFKKQTLFIMYVGAGNLNVKYETMGVEKNEDGTLNITIYQELPHMYMPMSTGYALTIAMDKETAKGVNIFDISYFTKEYNAALI